MEDETQVTTEVAAESGEVQSAETEEATEVTQDASTENGDDESTSQEAQEGTEEQEDGDKGPKKLSAEERKAQVQSEIQELIAQKNALKKEITEDVQRQLEEERKAAVKPFADDATVQTVKRNVAVALKQIEDIRADIAIADEVDPALAERLLDLEEYVTGARSALRADAEAKAKYEKEQQTRTVQERELAEKVEVANRAVAAYCKELKITTEVQKQAEQWFKAKMEASPTLAMQHKEIFDRQGPVAAAVWAVDYVKEHMGKDAQAAKDAKEKAKGNTVAGKTSTGGITVNGKAIRTWSDLQALSSTDINKFYKENPKEFERLKDHHFK